MKKLIFTLLLLTGLAAYSQPKAVQGNTQASHADIPSLPQNVNLTLEEINLYSKECFNDSTIQCYWVVFDPAPNYYSCDANCKFYGQPCAQRYVHREETFVGFVTYLKKKYSSK